MKVYEEHGNVVVEMHIPNIDHSKIKVSIKDGFLKVSGEQEKSKEEKKNGCCFREASDTSFEDVVELNAKVEEDKIKTEYKGDILKVIIPKK